MQRGFAVIYLLIGIVLILAFGGVYYLGKTSNLPSPISNPVVTPKPTSINETANWKTYTNNDLGYVLKYPANWSVSNNCEGEQSNSDYVCILSSEGIGLQIYNKGPINNLSFDLNDYPNPFCQPGGPITISDCNAVDYKGIKGATRNVNNKKEIVIFKGKKVLVDIILKDELNKELLTQILSTFKFN
jgi:hypothetical protein